MVEQTQQLNETEIRYKAAMERVAREGVVHLPDFLDSDQLSNFQYQLEQMPFLQPGFLDTRAGNYLVPGQIPSVAKEELESLGAQVKSLIASYALEFPILGDWEPTTINIQKYSDRSYLSAHREVETNIGVIAILMAQGELDFEARPAKHGRLIDYRLLNPGSLTLLRAHHLVNTKADPRLFYGLFNDEKAKDAVTISFGYQSN